MNRPPWRAGNFGFGVALMALWKPTALGESNKLQHSAELWMRVLGIDHDGEQLGAVGVPIDTLGAIATTWGVVNR